MAPGAFEAAITLRTRAVIVVHLYGRPAAIESIVSIAHAHGIRVLEDCAQAHGAHIDGRRCGSFGDAAAFSFYPTKNLGAYGDGGMLVSSDPETADRARLLRQYGWRTQYLSEITGMNSRLDEIQAAILRVRLRHLDVANNARRVLADRYIDGLSDLGALLTPLGTSTNGHVYHLFVVESPRRDALREYLSQHDIGSGIHYPLPVHLQPAYRDTRIGPGGLPVTERAAETVLSLPMYPELSMECVDRVIEVCRELAATR
jgi:dTDP-3-amino-3,4,6-trideoxy-alpha-D-glucose transaminase